ncbi:MAG: COG3014 family protein [Pseudobdellovibrionaceae bacterium]
MRFALITALLLTAGCASYQSKVSESRSLLKQGRTTEALAKLETLAQEESKDQLIYLLDYATALQVIGDYKQSTQVFLKADRFADLQDYHSVTNLVGATLGGEESIQYKGESFEKFLINTMLALNFLSQNNQESALVEARRINEKISKMRMDGREPYELSPFAKYLSGLVWESQGRFDDAYISFEQTYQLDPSIPFIKEDLVRGAIKARRSDSAQDWKKKFSEVQESDLWLNRQRGELVVLVQQGWGPVKGARPGDYTFPQLFPQRSETAYAQVSVDGQPVKTTQVVYNIEKVAIETMNKDYGALVARRVGGVAAKAVVADQVRQQNQLLGDLAWIAMNVADRADVRQWSTLPETIQMARLQLPPGKYKIKIHGISSGGTPTGEALEDVPVLIKSGQRSFVTWRALK